MRRVARRKLLISEINRIIRLKWVREYVDWEEEWDDICWSNKT